MVAVVTNFSRWKHFSPSVAAMFEERKRVFVDLFKWDVPVVDGRFEIDQFDDDTAVYLLISEAEGRHHGSLRLLRTDRPHILSSLFPYLCEQGVPAGPHILEITRLCLSPRLPATERLQLRNRLISAMTDYAVRGGITALTGVVSVRFLSQILAMGWRCELLGPPQLVDGAFIGAFRIHIDAATPRNLEATGIYTAETIQSVAPHGLLNSGGLS